MKTEGSKEQIAYIEARKKYLLAGKRYSSLLKEAMSLDPNILKIADDIMVTGDGLSVHDNRFLTSFYNELRKKSKIDKKYYELLLDLKKAKQELDNSVTALSRHRVNHLLRQAGIPPRKTNQDRDIIAAQVNNSNIGLLEKISLPGILLLEDSEALDRHISSGDITIGSGALTAKSKSTREFVRDLERKSRQKVNEDHLLDDSGDFLKRYNQLESGSLLGLIRISADKEHIREIERRIDSGDISFSGGNLVAVNEKGKKYLSLLVEELTACLEKKIKAHLLDKNKKCVQSDPRFGKLAEALKDLDITTDRHGRLSALAGEGTSYKELLEKLDNHKTEVKKDFADLITLQETVSVAFVDIKKQLLAVTNKKETDVEKILSLLMAVRYLSNFEKKYETKLASLEGKLGIVPQNNHLDFGPEPITKLLEKHADKVDEAEINEVVAQLVESRLQNRQSLGAEIDKSLSQFLHCSPRLAEYQKLFVTQETIKKHVAQLLVGSDCLYLGMGNVSELLNEIAQLEIEKNDKLAEMTHELEIAHKEFWLARIVNSSRNFVNTNFDNLSGEVRDRAVVLSRGAVDTARKDIKVTFEKYLSKHKKCSGDFTLVLDKALRDVSAGGDVSEISAKLKAKYKEVSKQQTDLFGELELEIMEFEKRLAGFEKKIPQELEKILISDIRKSI